MSQPILNFGPVRHIYSVSELSAEIRNLFERQFPDIWVMGEISNFRIAGSGHLYFTLKDESAQLRAVCFRNQSRYLKFKPQDGMTVIARGRLSVYEVRGEYQIYVELLEPAGLGALQLAFEQLKQMLAAEGLFYPGRKKPLPVLPRTIGVVTSAPGLRDNGGIALPLRSERMTGQGHVQLDHGLLGRRQSGNPLPQHLFILTHCLKYEMVGEKGLAPLRLRGAL